VGDDRVSDELDALVDALNAGVPAGAKANTAERRPDAGPGRWNTEDGRTARLNDWLQAVVARGGSDLLLVAGAPPSVRVNGNIGPIDALAGPMSGEEIAAAILPALAPHARRGYREHGVADSSYRMPDLERFRINLHHERGRAAAAIRRLPTSVPRLQSLNLPSGVDAITRLTRGLVLVGGHTGAGKTTTMAALVNEINHRDARHIITIEDPIEYEHTHGKCLIEQIEIGVDAPDFPTALRAALRQAPDVIVVGEMRDLETMHIAVAAGETGHLVLSSIHATDVAGAVARIADSFPLERQHTIREELAMALGAVLTQTLMPKTGGGLIPAAELLMVGYGARQHVRKNALHHLNQEITITRKSGSFTLEECLSDLVKRDLVDRKDAVARAVHVEELARLLGSLG
jgi:twitching motility protein PilT